MNHTTYYTFVMRCDDWDHLLHQDRRIVHHGHSIQNIIKSPMYQKNCTFYDTMTESNLEDIMISTLLIGLIAFTACKKDTAPEKTPNSAPSIIIDSHGDNLRWLMAT